MSKKSKRPELGDTVWVKARVHAKLTEYDYVIQLKRSFEDVNVELPEIHRVEDWELKQKESR